MPRVSVIILTRNRAHMLPTAIESVLGQTFRDIELIVVDDASTDDTPSVVAHYGPRVRYVRKPHNEGEAAGRNTGLHAAIGEFIAFLDDDDYYFPEKIALQVRMLDARPEIGLAYCRFVYADAQGKPVWQSGVLPEGDVLAELVSFCFVLSHAPLTRRSSFEQIGDFDTTLPSSPDWDMWLRMARAGIRFGCVQRPLVAYRQHGANITKGVDRWRAAHTLILDRIFSDSGLPKAVAAQRGQAYASSRASSAIAYYNCNDIARAQADLTEALSYDSGLNTPEMLARTLVDGAIELGEAADPLPRLARMFEHLPSAAQNVKPLWQEARTRARIRHSLWLFANAARARADQVLTDAVVETTHDNPDTKVVDTVKLFCNELGAYAVAIPVQSRSSAQFVQERFDTLPSAPSAGDDVWSALRHQRDAVVADVALAEAFDAHVARDSARVRRSIAMAIRHRPAVLRNRGVWSIGLRAVLQPQPA